ncbi:flagellar filament capping protein FliD [Thalassospira lucentensis]|uniref:flagellar filament capping protein FliD n=1 Tax=Thalassospira lucentensis TaxID=168935 RepID=UPI002941FBD0|nr:flagellar filament capping protein FliD [Thalassospira lucentensis]WOI12735.1 flagellar filament capping protein FliD [Thalassospira lucentensis]
MSTVNSSTSSSYVSSSYVSGLTDLDTAQLVEDAYNVKMEVADTIEAEVDELELEIAAFEDLQDLLEALEDAAEALTASAELESLRDDVWVGKSAYLSSSDANTTASDVLGVLVDDEAAVGSYTIEIKQMATAHKLGGDTYADASASAGLSGTLSLVAGDDYTATDIEISGDMSLDDIADAINDQSSATGVRASVLQISDDEYMLVLSAIDTGQEITFDTDGADTTIAASLGLINADGSYANELVAADQAIFSVDGVEVTRSSNTVDDVIDGVTLYLYAEEAGTEITLEIDEDASSVYDAIEAFVTAYNELRSFVITNQAYEAGEGASEDAVLFGDSLLSSVVSSVYDALSFTDDSDTYASLSSIGITFDESNYLVIDSETLEDALVSNFDEVADLFSLSTDTGSGNLLVSEADGTYTGTFTIDIAVDADGNITSASVGGDSSLFTISGNNIIGAQGSVYEGVELYFGGDSSESVDVTISSGLANEMVNALDKYTNSSDGLISARIDRLEEQTSDLEDEIDEVTTAAEAYAEDLTERYSALETKMYQLQLLREQLEALWGDDE